MKIISLVGARPQFIKEAILNSEVHKNNAWNHILVHSGQHYDLNMSDIFFQELGIPQPHYYLGVGSGTHAETTAAVLTNMEKILIKEKPDALIVYGDTNTTLGGALAAAKVHIPVIHVEAGIRMLPRSMPEEINRVTTDHLSSVLCCCSEISMRNLEREGITEGTHICGDIMYDIFLRMSKTFDKKSICKKYDLTEDNYIVTTIHRDYNTDNHELLGEIVAALEKFQKKTGLRVIFPAHPRTCDRLTRFSLMAQAKKLHMVEPLGYSELLSLISGARFVVTDSGGLQREAYYAHKRSIVIMPDTGWRELIATGWNKLCSANEQTILAQCEQIEAPCPMPLNCYGIGDAAEKIISAVHRELQRGSS